MTQSETDLHDIYQTDEPPQETAPTVNVSDLIGRQLRRQRIWTAAIGLLMVLLAVCLTVLVVKEYLIAGQPAPAMVRVSFFEAYSLPEGEQWALEYRQIAFQAEHGEPAGAKPLSTKWVKNSAYHIIMGEQALRLNNLSAARHHLEKAREAFPELSGIQRSLGVVYLKQMDYKKASGQLQAALQEQSSVDVLNNMGAALIGTRQYEKAEGLLKEALEQRPDLSGGYKNLALLYHESGRDDEAVIAFETYFTMNPQDTEMLEHYVAWRISEGKTGEVTAFLGQLEGADPAASFLLLAGAFAEDGDADNAVRALREAARYMTPRQTIVEMRGAAFRKIARTEPFEEFLHRMELAAVSLSSGLEEKEKGEQKTGR